MVCAFALVSCTYFSDLSGCGRCFVRGPLFFSSTVRRAEGAIPQVSSLCPFSFVGLKREGSCAKYFFHTRFVPSPQRAKRQSASPTGTKNKECDYHEFTGNHGTAPCVRRQRPVSKRRLCAEQGRARRRRRPERRGQEHADPHLHGGARAGCGPRRLAAAGARRLSRSAGRRGAFDDDARFSALGLRGALRGRGRNAPALCAERAGCGVSGKGRGAADNARAAGFLRDRHENRAGRVRARADGARPCAPDRRDERRAARKG